MNRQSHSVRSGPRSSAILAAAVLVAVALPVSVVLPREAERPQAAPLRSELVVPAAAMRSVAMPPSTINMTSERVGWTDAASQSAYMLLVGSLLIGIGSIVKRTV